MCSSIHIHRFGAKLLVVDGTNHLREPGKPDLLTMTTGHRPRSPGTDISIFSSNRLEGQWITYGKGRSVCLGKNLARLSLLHSQLCPVNLHGMFLNQAVRTGKHRPWWSMQKALYSLKRQEKDIEGKIRVYQHPLCLCLPQNKIKGNGWCANKVSGPTIGKVHSSKSRGVSDVPL